MSFIIKRKILITMLFTALTMLGWFSYKQLAVELYPNAQIPFLFVNVGSVLEVDPEYMEKQAIIPIEGAIGTLDGVDKIESTAGQQQGTIRVSYNKSTNIKFAYLKLIEKIDETKNNLPEEFRVQVFKFDLEQLNNMFMTIQARGSGGVDRVRQVVEREIINKFKNINGISNAEIFGGREKSVDIILKEDVCNSYNITPANVRTALNNNSLARTFVGKVTQNSQLHSVNVVSEFVNLNDLYEVVVIESENVKLRDIATINFGLKEQESYSRVNGKESVTIQLTRDSQANQIELAEIVEKQIALINEEFGRKDIELVIQNNSAEIMEKNIDLIIQLALIGGLLAIFILWVFLRNLKLVIAVALAIPISVFTAFNCFYAYDITINSLTLLGMALAIGMLLDNSVVVLENIYRLAAKNVNIGTAVIQGTKEVSRSIIAATLTTVTVFLPFVFSSNFFIGLLGKHIGVSIISTLLVSLAVALLFIPMISYVFLSLKKSSNSAIFQRISYHNRLIQIYLVFLKTSMRNPGRVIPGALGIFFVTLIISLGISTFSTEEPEIKDLKLYVTMPGGTTLENTDLFIAEVEKKLDSLQEKKDILSQIYEEEAVITVTLSDNYRDIRNLDIPGIKNDIIESLEDFKQAQFDWDPPVTGGRFGSGGFDDDDGMARILGIGTQQEKIIIKGEDFDQMLNKAHDVEYYLGRLTSIKKINIRLPEKRPEVQLLFDKQLMSLYDIPITSVLSELNSFQPQFSSGVLFKQDNQDFDIQIKMPDIDENITNRNIHDLKTLNVRGSGGSSFELQNISGFNFTTGLSTIKRKNQEKQIEVVYEFLDEVNDENDLLTASRAEVDDLIESLGISSGTIIEVVHEDDELGEFGFLLLMAVLLIYMILASVFESFTMPVVMMFSIPLAAIGSLILLILTGTSIMNANVFTGFLILLGIVVNNGIMMIDYTRVLQKRGYRESRALMTAGLARVRPILITAITTIIALIPLAIGKAEYVTQIGVPFAITVIGGLALSTMLTLVFIPTMYSGLESAISWMKQQHIAIKILQVTLWVIGTYFIYMEVDSKVWQLIYFILLMISVPSAIYFIKTSLRKASEKLIADNQLLYIEIRNIVKIYDWDNRFMREWKSGLNIRKRLGIQDSSSSTNIFTQLIWQLPVIGFSYYFIYFHIESGFWYFILQFIFYILVLVFSSAATIFFMSTKRSRWLQIIYKLIYAAFYWGYPAIALYSYYDIYSIAGLVIPTGVIWYLAIAVNFTANNLHKNNVDVNRVTGLFKGIRKAFYRFVLVIPLLGKKKKPFKAVTGVRFEIENGMFGLLGPNGAGKSTLMRIICGILEPSYGQITINGIDLKEKREELQGLIGYLPQEFGMYENMTAWDFLNYIGILKKLYDKVNRNNRVEYVLKAVHMYDSRNEKIGSFSGGMKQRIGIAQILLHLPRILVVDEPTAGLDPRERIRFRNLLVELSKERIVIFSTHIIEDVASSCNRVAVMKKGSVVYLGKPIDMADIAEGSIWTLNLHISEFEKIKDNLTIIYHIREKEMIKVRCLADEPPAEGAQSVKANLEDAYLYLLKKNGN
ncbi:MAG: efflux RND transporter permease subunit [Bacteroidetes bacterium]|nr:efflux RND transporter permease subunit [Bacteroidota bacterium]MBL6944093.1 efflux RND transporter permease subunit [Bacteroidales bacterium]